MQDGFTSLHLAFYVGNEDMASLLLKQRASTDARTDGGHTALNIVVLIQHTRLAQLLVNDRDHADVMVA